MSIYFTMYDYLLFSGLGVGAVALWLIFGQRHSAENKDGASVAKFD